MCILYLQPELGLVCIMFWFWTFNFICNTVLQGTRSPQYNTFSSQGLLLQGRPTHEKIISMQHVSFNFEHFYFIYTTVQRGTRGPQAMCPSFRYNTHFLAEDFQSTVVVLLTQRPANTWKEKAEADHIVKALPPFSLFLCTTSHSGWRGGGWKLKFAEKKHTNSLTMDDG